MQKINLVSGNIPQVRIDFMNQTHEEEVEMVNNLQESLNASISNEGDEFNISKQLTAWLEHTQAHFSRENELMQKTGFPAYTIHSGEHQIALQQMQLVVDDWEKNKNSEALKEYVFIQWPNWFLTHVNSMDMVTAEFAVSNGYPDK